MYYRALHHTPLLRKKERKREQKKKKKTLVLKFSLIFFPLSFGWPFKSFYNSHIKRKFRVVKVFKRTKHSIKLHFHVPKASNLNPTLLIEIDFKSCTCDFQLIFWDEWSWKDNTNSQAYEAILFSEGFLLMSRATKSLHKHNRHTTAKLLPLYEVAHEDLQPWQ